MICMYMYRGDWYGEDSVTTCVVICSCVVVGWLVLPQCLLRMFSKDSPLCCNIFWAWCLTLWYGGSGVS